MFGQQNENIPTTIMNEFSKTVEMFALTPIESRLFAYLYLVEKPLTLDEMSEALGKSKTSMSYSIRSLFDLNLVTRVWKKGVRKDLYKANTQLFKLFMNYYINKWIDATNHQKDSLIEISKTINYKKGNSQENAMITERLESIINFHCQVEKAFKDMKRDW